MTALAPLILQHQRVHRAWELSKRPVTGQLDQPSTMPGQYRLKALFAMFPEAGQRAALVPAHQPGVADHVGSEDRCQLALLALHQSFYFDTWIVEGPLNSGNGPVTLQADTYRCKEVQRAPADSSYSSPTRSISSGRLFFTLPTSVPTSHASIAPP